jgi:hypothetical protein
MIIISDHHRSSLIKSRFTISLPRYLRKRKSQTFGLALISFENQVDALLYVPQVIFQVFSHITCRDDNFTSHFRVLSSDPVCEPHVTVAIMRNIVSKAPWHCQWPLALPTPTIVTIRRWLIVSPDK